MCILPAPRSLLPKLETTRSLKFVTQLRATTNKRMSAMPTGSYDGGIDVLPTNFHAVQREKPIPGRLLYRIKSLTEKAQQKN